MHPEIDKLVRLQQIDGRLEILRKELASRPELVEAQDSRVIAIEERRESIAAARQAKKLEIDRTQLDIKGFESKIQETKGKIPNIKGNEEYAALMKQIDDLKNQQGDSEEKLLYLWEEMEAFESEDKVLDKELAEARKILEEERGTLAEESAEIRQQAEALLAERETARDPIEEELLETYDVLFSRYRDRSVVSADGGVCAGCHMSLNPQTMNMLVGSQLVTCKNCSRILFAE